MKLRFAFGGLALACAGVAGVLFALRSPAPSGGGGGLVARYYQGRTHEAVHTVRREQQVVLGAPGNQPSALVPPFWAEWVGSLYVTRAGDYRFELDSEVGGALYLDHRRVIDTWAGTGSAATVRGLDPGIYPLRVAMAAEQDAGFAELLWIPPGATRATSIPAAHLVPGDLQRQPREAAQLGLDWVTADAKRWQGEHRCFGCHVQAQALLGIAEGSRNGYRFPPNVMTELVGPIVRAQTARGWIRFRGDKKGHLMGAFGLAVADTQDPQPGLASAVAHLRRAQRPDGIIPPFKEEAPVMEGAAQSTALSIYVFQRQLEHEADSELVAAVARAADALEVIPVTTTHDRAHRVLGLAWAGRASQGFAEDLIAQQRADGGWLEHPELRESSPMATGQALYALEIARWPVDEARFRRGVEFLMNRQDREGYWQYRGHSDTRSKRPSRFAATMWAALGLGAAYGPLTVRIETPDHDARVGGGTLVRAVATNHTSQAIEQLQLFAGGVELASSGTGRLETQLARPLGVDETLELRAVVRLDDSRWAEDAIRVRGPAAPVLPVEEVPPDAGVPEDLTGLLEVTSGVRRFPQRLLFVIDQSGSMAKKLAGAEGRTLVKMKAAQDAIVGVIARVPVGQQLGIRAYGANAPRRARDCEDTHLAWKVEPLSEETRQMLSILVGAMRPRGMTPIAYALERGVEDLGGDGVMIVVSDGEETCGRDPCATAAKLASRYPRLQIHTVGFDIAENAAAREQMLCVAASGGGRYLAADDEIQLADALIETPRATVLIWDRDQQHVVAKTSVGAPPLSLPVGGYRLEVLLPGQAVSDVTIAAGATFTVRVEQ